MALAALRKNARRCRSARACPSHAPQQQRGILRSYRTLASCYRCVSIDIQVLSDLAFILFILRILAILIQTL